MPRYFYNIQGDSLPPNSDGVLLDGPEEARSQAVLMAGDMLKDTHGTFWGGPEWCVEVTDDTCQTVCVLTIKGR